MNYNDHTLTRNCIMFVNDTGYSIMIPQEIDKSFEIVKDGITVASFKAYQDCIAYLMKIVK